VLSGIDLTIGTYSATKLQASRGTSHLQGKHTASTNSNALHRVCGIW
jgi:hypothetical protein